MSTKKTPRRKSKKTPAQEVKIDISVKQEPANLLPAILEPLKEGGRFMIPKTWVSERQVVQIVQKTPPQYIYRRKGKGGRDFDYVTGWYITKVLNYVFGWNWDFEITDKGREQDQVWVLGKLSVKDDAGHIIVKSQFGRADIKFLRETKTMVDYGNDLKAAATDALKKCASELGIASDIYGKAEYVEEGVKTDIVATPTPKVAPVGKQGDKQPSDCPLIEQEESALLDAREALFETARDFGAKQGNEKQFIELKLKKRLAWNKLTLKHYSMLRTELNAKATK